MISQAQPRKETIRGGNLEENANKERNKKDIPFIAP
jgi:hypothetical protein